MSSTPKREKGTPNRPKQFKSKKEGWEKNLGTSETKRYKQLVEKVATDELMREMIQHEFKVLVLSKEELGRCYQSCMQNTNEDLLWVGSDRDAGGQKKRPWDSSNVPRVSVNQNGAQVKVVASHVMLVANGHVPEMLGLQASHYCHNAACMQHVIWEPKSDNEVKRKKCSLAKKCTCGLIPACNFSLHV
jgi:hypothetical protein